MVELENEDPREFKNMLRMEPAMFHELEARLTPRLLKRPMTSSVDIRNVSGESLSLETACKRKAI